VPVLADRRRRALGEADRHEREEAAAAAEVAVAQRPAAVPGLELDALVEVEGE
jgi:hypothetical protein